MPKETGAYFVIRPTVTFIYMLSMEIPVECHSVIVGLYRILRFSHVEMFASTAGDN